VRSCCIGSAFCPFVLSELARVSASCCAVVLRDFSDYILITVKNFKPFRIPKCT
jgi:hypothetical protein